MKKIIILVITVLGLTALLVAGSSCVGYVAGRGPVVNRDYNYTDFNSIKISNAFEYEINRSDSYSVTVTAHENIFEHLDITQSGETLLVRFKSGRYSNDVKVAVTMPEISELVISGASRGTLKGFKSTNDFTAEISGASRMEMDIEAGKTSIEASGASRTTGQLIAQDTLINVSGASRCDINGSAGLTDIEVSGASHFESPGFQMQNTNIEVSGASHATIYTKGTLNLELSGASTLDYSGNPILSKVDVSGASKLNSK